MYASEPLYSYSAPSHSAHKQTQAAVLRKNPLIKQQTQGTELQVIF